MSSSLPSHKKRNIISFFKDLFTTKTYSMPNKISLQPGFSCENGFSATQQNDLGKLIPSYNNTLHTTTRISKQNVMQTIFKNLMGRKTVLLGLFTVLMLLTGFISKAQNNALNFDGVDDRVNVGNPAALQFPLVPGTQVTIESWVNIRRY